METTPMSLHASRDRTPQALAQTTPVHGRPGRDHPDQTSPKHPLHQRGNKSTVSRTGVSLRSIDEFKEPQLLGGKQQSGLMPAWFGAIEHQGFLSSQWDQRPLR